VQGGALSLANADLVSAAALDEWLRDVAGVAPDRAAELSLRLAEFRVVQSCLLNLFDAAIDGRPLPVDSVEQLNGTSARVPRVAALGDDGSSLEPLAASGASRVLAEIAWSAIDLLGGPERERLRRCGACGTIFVATRPDRLWCSDRCGNRIRVARHHARSRNPSYPVRR
jgi:predicted RNA-binding Zn ribbon-like protein